MLRKRNLFDDLKIKKRVEGSINTLDIDIKKIKSAVSSSIVPCSLKSEMEENAMRTKFRVAFLSAAIVSTMALSIYAAGSLVKYTTGTNEGCTAYSALPEKEALLKDVGFSPVLIEQFNNGYVYTNGTTVSKKNFDEGEQLINEYKSLNLNYEKGENEVSIFACKASDRPVEKEGALTSVGGTDVYYSESVVKFVPENYKKTPEDEMAEAKGELEISFGSKEVEIMRYENVSFEKDAVSYYLLQSHSEDDNSSLKGTLLEMAKEIIEAK